MQRKADTRSTVARKIVHLMVDDKFIDSAVREFEAVQPGVHEYVIVDAKPPYRYVRSAAIRTVARAAWADRVAQPDVGGVVLHSLPAEHHALLQAIPPGPTVIWLGWGYDYYGLVSDAFPDGLLQPASAAAVAQLHGRRERHGAMRAAELAWARPYPKPSQAELAALQRVDIFSPVLENEYALVRRHQGALRARYLRWNYGTVEDDLSLADAPAVDALEPGTNLLVGNSAAPANNHLELFELIRCRVDLGGRQLIVPLSYGDAAYRGHIERVGRQMFGDAFVPLVEFLPKQHYIELLVSCGHVLMNHVRQQALGNLVISGMLGAKLHLNPKSPIGPWLRRIGIGAHDVERLDLSPVPRAQRLAQAAALRAELNRDAQRVRTRALIDAALA